MSASATPQMDRTTIGRSALWSVTSMGAGQGLALLTFLVTARYVSKESFGIMAVSLAVVEFLKRVWIEPFSLAVTTRVDAQEEDYDACFLLTVAATALLVALLLAGAEGARATGAGGDVVAALRLVAGLTFTVGLWRTHEAWLVRHMAFRTLAIRTIAASILGGVTGVTMAVWGFDLWSLVGQQVVTGVSSTILLWATSPWRPRLRTTRAAVVENLKRAKHLSLSAAGIFFSSETDIFVASGVLGIEAAGLYNAAKRVMLAMHLFLTNSIQAVTLPTFANIPDAEARRGASLRAVGVVASVTLPAAFGIMALSGPIVSVLLGEKWSAAAPVLAALALGLGSVSLLQFDNAIFMVAGRFGAVTRFAVLNAALNALLLPAAALFGSTALALGVSAVQLVVYPLATRSALKTAGLAGSDYMARIGRPLLASALMAALLAVAQRSLALNGIVALVVLVPGGAAIYFALLSWIGPAALRELVGLARSILRRSSPVLA